MSVPSTTQTSQVPISKAKPELKRMPGTNNILSQMPRTEKNSLEQIKKSLETRKHEEEQAKLQMRKDQESSSREESPLQFQKPIRPAQHNSSTDAAEEKRQQAREQVRQMLLTESSQRSLQKLPSSTETAEESNGASNPSSSQEHASSPSCGSNASSNTSVGKKRGLGFASLLTSMIFGKPDHNDKNAMQCPKTPDKCVRASPQTSTPISYAISPYVGYAHFPFHCHTHTLTHTHTHTHTENTTTSLTQNTTTSLIQNTTTSHTLTFYKNTLVCLVFLLHSFHLYFGCDFSLQFTGQIVKMNRQVVLPKRYLAGLDRRKYKKQSCGRRQPIRTQFLGCQRGPVTSEVSTTIIGVLLL